jgi:uncharacterized protein (TIRG00374 family)
VGQVWAALWELELSQIGFWLVFNIGLALLMAGRWWLILGTLGHKIPYLALIRYRFASFAVSYFTPGPQFGGEPLQVLALRARHGVPGTTGTASVSLDKLLEMIANFSFLVIGISVALAGAWLPEEWHGTGMTVALSLLIFPLLYLILMLNGRHPLTALIDQLPEKLGQNWLVQNLRLVECEMSMFCTTRPGTVIAATLISVSVWVGMVGEYWLLTWFLGLRLTLSESISAMVAARLSFLTPLPGGLGALEASQMLALRLLEQPESLGIGLALLIRFRDILFGAVGLLGAISLLDGNPFKSPKVGKFREF